MANPIYSVSTFVRSIFTRSSNSDVVKKDLNRYISPVQLERIKQDIATWRQSLVWAENAWYPKRYEMQRLFQDTVLNGQVIACMESRKDLTLLRDYTVETAGGTEDEYTKKLLKQRWFSLWVNYGLDALAYGYQLVAFGDIVDNTFPYLTIVKRQNVSPDRYIVGAFVSTLVGEPFLEDPFADWHTYFDTPTQNAASKCGYGYLYPVAYYEIFLRLLTGANGGYLQTFGQPFIVGKTSKTEQAERNEMLQMLLSMAQTNAAVIDPEDYIELKEAKGGTGNGSNGYANFEERLEKKISKIILGHADAIDSTTGKLGAGQGEDNSPVAKAIKNKKTKDGEYIENMVNNVLFGKLRNLGFAIPDGVVFKYKNDEEEKLEEERENQFNQGAATIMKTISDAGGEPDWKWFEDRTGIKVEKKEVELPATDPPTEESIDQSQRIKNKLENLYGPR